MTSVANRFAVVVCLFLAAAGFLNAGTMRTSPESSRFGSAARGSEVSGRFTVESLRDDAVSLNIIAGCSCMTVHPASIDLEPGESRDVVWTLDTAGYRGETAFDIIINGGGETLYHEVSGTVGRTAPYRTITRIFVTVFAAAIALVMVFRRRRR